MKWPGVTDGIASATSRPGRRSVSSVVALSTLPAVDVAVLRHLTRCEACEGSGRHVVGDDRTGRNPCIVADLDGRHERIVNRPPDVAADRGLALRPPRLVRKVGGDRARADVRAGADLRVANVGKVWHLCALPDPRVLDLDECPRLRAGLEDGAGAKVTERPDQRARPDPGVDRHHVRADLGALSDLRGAPEDGERVDDGVAVELD